MSADVYWRMPFAAMASGKALTEYVVLDVELVGPPQGRLQLADVQVARKADFGRNDTTFFSRTHLGHLLHPGARSPWQTRLHPRAHQHTTFMRSQVTTKAITSW